jgi:hypothetical protein
VPARKQPLGQGYLSLIDVPDSPLPPRFDRVAPGIAAAVRTIHEKTAKDLKLRQSPTFTRLLDVIANEGVAGWKKLVAAGAVPAALLGAVQAAILEAESSPSA